jgi:flagellar protein FlaG
MTNEMPSIMPPQGGGTPVSAASMNGADGSGRISSLRLTQGDGGKSTTERTNGVRRESEQSLQEERLRRDESGKDELAQAVEEINERSELLRRNLQFSVDNDSGRTVIKVIDSQTKEVIRQIPKEEILDIARSLEKTEGLLFQARA